MDLHYLSYDLGDYYESSVTSRALPTSKRAILVEKGNKKLYSAVSSSRRLPPSIGGLLGRLNKHFCTPKLLLGPPQESAERRLGSLFPTPYFLGGSVNVAKRIGAIAFPNTNGRNGWSALQIWIWRLRESKTAHDPLMGRCRGTRAVS